MKLYSKIRSEIVLALLTLATAAGYSQTCTVNWTNVYQRIDGFGASSAFSGRTWSSTTANIFFSTNNVGGNVCIGLSLLRNQIQPGGFASTSERGLMTLAEQRGVRVWSSPWSPQASFKTNNNTVGGYFSVSNYQAYAAQLANYVKTNAAAGVSIYAVSIQNEPDANVSYVSCHWTPQQIHDFTTNLYNAFVASNVASTKIILPESQNWTDPSGLATTTVNDANSLADVGVIANHNYVANNLVGDQTTPAVVNNYGKALWETEVATLSSSTATNYFDPSITNAMYWATRIHLFLTVAQINAWHYWYLITGTNPSDNEGLMGTGDVPSKRMYVVGQFSRFVRPNYYRIGVVNNTNTLISAYNDTNSGNFVIVAVNTNSSTAINQTFNLANFSATTVTPWITSATMSLSNQTPVSVGGTAFTYSLPAMSVVTFVGQNSSSTTPAATTLSLASGANPSTYGNMVTFTATVQTNGVAVGGISGEPVTFYDGATTLGIGTLNNSGQAAYTTTDTELLAVTHSITAVYGGDANYSASTNTPALSQMVSALEVTVTNVLVLDKVYDGTTNAGLDANQAGLNGILSGDNVTLVTNGAAGYFADAAVGTAKPVTVTGYTLAGSDAGNYMLTQPAGLTADILPLVTPIFSSPAISGGLGGWQLNFSGQAGQSYRVLATGDVTLPLNQWTVLTNAMFDASGAATFTDTTATNLPQRFYQIGSP